jgi:hypothetical protein
VPKPPDGLPGYGWEQLLELAGMATVTMLKRHRREPADGQKPVGYYWTGHGYALLYKASEAVAMPPLSPGRQRRYDQARTCAECGNKSLDPCEKGRDGKRYCQPCQDPVHERLWRQERADDRPVITAWARAVLDDPTAVLAAARGDRYWREVFVIDLTGKVVLDARVRYHDASPDPAHPMAAELAVKPSPSDMLMALGDARVVVWSWSTAPLGPDGRTIGHDKDHLGGWYARWLGEVHRASAHPYRYEPRVANPPPLPAEPADQVGWMRQLLAEMATGQAISDQLGGGR